MQNGLRATHLLMFLISSSKLTWSLDDDITTNTNPYVTTWDSPTNNSSLLSTSVNYSSEFSTPLSNYETDSFDEGGGYISSTAVYTKSLLPTSRFISTENSSFVKSNSSLSFFTDSPDENEFSTSSSAISYDSSTQHAQFENISSETSNNSHDINYSNSLQLKKSDSENSEITSEVLPTSTLPGNSTKWNSSFIESIQNLEDEIKLTEDGAMKNASAVIVLPSATEGEDIIPLSSLSNSTYLDGIKLDNDTETSSSFLIRSEYQSLNSEDLLAAASKSMNMNFTTTTNNKTIEGTDSHLDEVNQTNHFLPNINNTSKSESLNITNIINSNKPNDLNLSPLINNISNLNLSKKNNINAPENTISKLLNSTAIFELPWASVTNNSTIATSDIKQNNKFYTDLPEIKHILTKTNNKGDNVSITKMSLLNYTDSDPSSTNTEVHSNMQITLNPSTESLTIRESNKTSITQNLSTNNEEKEGKMYSNLSERSNIDTIYKPMNQSSLIANETENKNNYDDNNLQNKTLLLRNYSTDSSLKETLKYVDTNLSTTMTPMPSLDIFLNSENTTKSFGTNNNVITQSSLETTPAWIEAPFFHDFKAVRTLNRIQLSSKSSSSTSVYIPHENNIATYTNESLNLHASTNNSSTAANINLFQNSTTVSSLENLNNNSFTLPNFKGIKIYKIGIEDAKPSGGINISNRLKEQLFSNFTPEMQISSNLNQFSHAGSIETTKLSHFRNISEFVNLYSTLPSITQSKTNQPQSSILAEFSIHVPVNYSHYNDSYVNSQEVSVTTAFPNISEDKIADRNNHFDGKTEPTIAHGIPFGLANVNKQVKLNFISSNNESINTNDVTTPITTSNILSSTEISNSSFNPDKFLNIKINADHLQISKENTSFASIKPLLKNNPLEIQLKNNPKHQLVTPSSDEYNSKVPTLKSTSNPKDKEEIEISLTAKLHPFDDSATYNDSYPEMNILNKNSTFSKNEYQLPIGFSARSKVEDVSLPAEHYMKILITTQSTLENLTISNPGNYSSGNTTNEETEEELPLLPTPASFKLNNFKSLNKRSILNNASNASKDNFIPTFIETTTIDKSVKTSDAIDSNEELNETITSKACGIYKKSNISNSLESIQEEHICWHANLLRKPDSSYFCSGVIVEEKWILTSAVCVEKLQPQDFTVKLGGLTSLNGIDSNQVTNYYKIESIKIHSERNNSFNNLALLKLQDFPKQTESDTCKICLPDDSWRYHNYSAKHCIVTGFGVLPEAKKYPKAMKIISAEIMDETSCQNIEQKYDNETVLCTRNKNISYGDQGSPLVCKDGNHFILSGITSWNIETEQIKFITIFSKVSNYLQWIQKTINF